jgi:NodT family efflux transporter outer membrane factor (OMF) lipoprotein
MRPLTLLLLCTLAAQARSKPAPKPNITLPDSYSKPLHPGGDLAFWWVGFEDASLTGLIQMAEKKNFDLTLAQTRLLEARATTRQAQSALLPSPSTSLSFTNSQRSNNSPAIPRIDAPQGAAGPDLIPRRYSLFDTTIDVSYELDFYGANRKSRNATRADELAQQEDWNDTKVSLTAELARNYFNLREAQARRAVTRQNISSFEQSLQLTTLRRQAGLATQQDEVRLRSQIESSRASLPQLEARIEESLQALALLCATSANTLAEQLGDADTLPKEPRQIPGALPSDLLKRRPDIRKAFAQLDAATLRRQSAESDWFPKLKLTASTGGQSGDLTNLLSANSIISSLSPKLSWGALNYKQTRASIDQKSAKESQQLATIEKTLATAFKEVETALSAYHREKERLTHLQQSTAAQEQLAQIAATRYQSGLDTILPVLEAERSVISARDLELQSQANIRRNLITLFKALGGGW